MKKLRINLIFPILILIFNLAACQSEDTDTIPLQAAYLLRNQEDFGLLNQEIAADVTESLQEGDATAAQISGGSYEEDSLEFQELLLLFPAEEINGQQGYFILGLSVRGEDPNSPTSMIARGATMVADEGEYNAQVEMVANGAIGERWAYSRLPNTRQVYLGQDDQAEESVGTSLFHQAALRGERPLPVEIAQDGDWTTVSFALPSDLIENSKSIDKCETLFEELDKAFTSDTGEFLQWSAPLVTEATISDEAKKLESVLLADGQTFNLRVTVGGTDILYNEPVTPQVEQPITLISEENENRPAVISCSVSG